MYGITRRGFGASDHPATGYDDQRLANDVVAIIEAMPIAKPVLVGHSAAGNEMTTVASQHPDLASGLIWKQQRGRTCSRDLADEDQVSEVLQRALS